MKRLSQEKLVETVKRLRKARSFTQEQLCSKTGINRQIENNEHLPSIPQLEKLAEILGFEITDLYVEDEPMIYRSSMPDHMFEMMMAARQQMLLKKAMA